MAKVIAVNGSPRYQGNTYVMLNIILEKLKKYGHQVELINIANKKINGCVACYKCADRKNKKCAIENDMINECIEKLTQSDAIILGSPTYFADVTSDMKAFIDRCGFVCRANGDLLKRKLGAAVVSVRRGGAIHTFDTLNHFFTIAQMIVVGSCYWNIGIGRAPGDVVNDSEGIATMETLAENINWLLDKISN
ncbi:MAG TPA: flavodoxin family protein [bacterium]|nr:flavodoxin family protein [bacterium]